MASVRSVVFDLIGRDNFSAAALKASNSAATAATSMERSMARVEAVANKTAAVGKKMSMAVTLPIAAIAGESIKQAVDFQKSMTLLQTAGGETADKMTQISDGIKKLAIQTGTSLQQLNAGMYTVAKFGSRFSAADQLLILKAAAEGAKAENVDLGVATNALTTVMQSYGAKASAAVAIQNELVVAAGRSKTNMTDFAQSLSNVIPLASSLGISFAQVGGAIATMTQHGESAQHATDNLNNLIRNLAGQNNVASQAMQQLGIDTLTLRRNLAQNGLTGTLDMVEAALAKSSKSGLIVVSAFKNAQLATQSLNQMLGSMSGNLEVQSKALLKGSTSIKDYRTYARSLGGDAGAAALQFLALYQQTQGFSNALKSGNSTVSTAAAQLQKMLGGATGLNVALMLGGNSAAAFKANVSDIGAAAQKSGADISTWAKTQQTLAVKTEQAREKLQVLAVNLGDKLLPIATKIVGVLAAAVTWFSHLSSGVQGSIIKFALIAAVIGPVLSIVGRLVKTGVLIFGWARQVAAAYGLVAVSSKAAAASMATTNAVAGTRASAGLLGWAGVGGKAAAGAGAAEAGAAEAGVVGGGAALAAVALPVAALLAGGKVLSNVLDSASNAAEKAVAGFGKALKTLNGQINDVNGALTMNTALTVANQLQTDGMGKKAAAAGISLTQLTEGLTGSNDQFNALIKTWKAGGSPSDDTIGALEIMRLEYQVTGDAAKKSAKDQSAAQKAAANAAKAAAKAAADAAAKVKAAAQATYLAAHPAFAAFQSVMQAVNRSTGDVKGATVAFGDALGQLALKGKTAQTGLTDSGTAAGAVADRFQRAAEGAISLAAAQKANGATSEDVAAKLERNVMALQAQAEKLGLNKDMVDGLLASMNLMPSQIDTYFNVDIAAALANIATLKAQLASLGGGGDAESRAQGGKVAGQLGAAAAKVAVAVAKVSSGGTTSNKTGGKIYGGAGGSGGGAGSGSALSSAADALTSFARSITGSNQDVGDAFAAVIKAGENAKKFGSGLVTYLSGEDTKLRLEVSKRNNLATALAAAQQKLVAAVGAFNDYRSSVSGAVSGTFDVSQVASPYSDQRTSTSTIITALRAAVANAGKFSTVIKGLVARHAAPGLIRQLLAAGPAALPQAQALLSASYTQLAEINADYGKLGSVANDLGLTAATDFYGAGVKSAQGIVAGLKSQEGVVARAVTELANVMVAQMKKALGIHSPSRVFHELGVNTGLGFVQGVSSMHPDAQRATAGLTNHGTPGSQHGAWRDYHHHDGDTFVIQEAVNPAATAQTVQRHQQMASRS